MASDTKTIRDIFVERPSSKNVLYSSNNHLAHDTPRSLFGDYDHPSHASLPAPPPLPEKTLTHEQKKRIKKQHKEQLYLTLQNESKQEKFDRQQAKLEQKQKKAQYLQMYQKQHDFVHSLDSRSQEKRQQLSLPIYPAGHQQWDPTPTAEVYYHASRHYHRNDIETSNKDSHLNSFSSTHSATTSSSRQTKNSPMSVSTDKARSMSLKHTTTKSMYDLRPWSGAPQSPTFDYVSTYDSDDTLAGRGWDSLMDTLYSPVSAQSSNSWSSSSLTVPDVSSPMSPPLKAGFKDIADPDLDQLVTTALATLALSHDKKAYGNGKYMLVLGANGRTGIELVKQGLERNYRVTAFVRDDKLLIEDPVLRKKNLIIIRGSPTSQADLDRCVEGQDVVINVIGPRVMVGDSTISSHAQVVLNNAMKKHGVRRLIAVTSYGCLGLRSYLISTKRLFSRMFMTSILKDKVLQEDIIQRDSAHLDWTIVRPITLKDGELTEKYVVSSELLPRTDNKIKILTRKDLAHYILNIINDSDQHHAIRSIAGKPKPFKPNPLCPFDRRRAALEQAKLEKEQEIERQLLEKKQQQQVAQLMQGDQKYQLQHQQHPQAIQPDITDTTPLLGNNNNTANGKKDKQGVRQHLLALTPLQSFIALLSLAAVVFFSVYLMLHYNLPKDIPEERKEWLKFPRNALEVQHLSMVLEDYVANHYYPVLLCFVSTYLAMQTFAIPGSVMLSVLAGALFKLWVGIFVVLFAASVGSTFCYLISYYLGHPIVEKYLTARIAKLKVKIDSKKDQLFFYFAFLRVTPFIPNWFMNVASPHLDIPIVIFYFGTLVGVLPNTLVTVQAGVTLAALASPDDFTLFTPQNIIMTIVICICLLIPIILHRHADDPNAEHKTDEEQETLARV
ncbi:Transmembrane protein 41B [Podila humilis]|nr:Transmembrane protein 41B [Podila humilis]